MKGSQILDGWQSYLHTQTLIEFFPDIGNPSICICPWLHDTTYYVMAMKICEVFAHLEEPAREEDGDGLGIPSDFMKKYAVYKGERAFKGH